MSVATEAAANVASVAIDAAANLAVLRRATDGQLSASIAALQHLVESHVEADLAAMSVLNAQMTANTVLTLQVKEILDGFKTFGAIVKFVLKWVALVGGAIAAVVALRK